MTGTVTSRPFFFKVCVRKCCRQALGKVTGDFLFD